MFGSIIGDIAHLVWPRYGDSEILENQGTASQEIIRDDFVMVGAADSEPVTVEEIQKIRAEVLNEFNQKVSGSASKHPHTLAEMVDISEKLRDLEQKVQDAYQERKNQFEFFRLHPNSHIFDEWIEENLENSLSEYQEELSIIRNDWNESKSTKELKAFRVYQMEINDFFDQRTPIQYV